MKGGAHQVKSLGAQVEQELIQLRASSCDEHQDEQVKIYCCDCNESICLMCSAVKHRSHNSVEIPEAANNFRPRVDDDDKAILCLLPYLLCILVLDFTWYNLWATIVEFLHHTTLPISVSF